MSGAVRVVTTSAVRLASASLGALAFGPLGAVIGGALGKVLEEPIAKVCEESVRLLGEKASDFFVHEAHEQFKESCQRPLEPVARQALRKALHTIRGQAPDYDDWFDHWDKRLEPTAPPLSSLHLIEVISEEKLLAFPDQTLDALFRAAMERLDGEGAGLNAKSTSISVWHFRKIEDPLLAFLHQHLPEPLEQRFHELLKEPQNKSALEDVTQRFRASVQQQLRDIKRDTSRILEILEQAPPFSTPAFSAPSLSDYFVGREALLESLSARLSRPGSLVPIIGMPGLGKTTAAIAFAHRFFSQFEGVYWVNCSGRTLGEAAAALATQLHLRLDRAYEDLLTDIQKSGQRHFLLVLDNVESDDFRQLIPPGRASILITTRHRDLAFLTQHRPLNLALFTPDECLALFRIHDLPGTPQESQLRLLAESLGWLPLGIAVAAGLLKNDMHYTVDRLLKDPHLHRKAHGDLGYQQAAHRRHH